MKKPFNTPEEFYKHAMVGVNQVVGSKLRILGVELEEIPALVEAGLLNKYNSEEHEGTIKEYYEYRGIKLAEFEWRIDGIKQRDINKDERDIRKNSSEPE